MPPTSVELCFMILKIHKKITDKLNAPVLLAGWPGMGNVGLGAVNYLRRQLQAEPFAELDMSELFAPEAVLVKDGIAGSFSDLPTHKFYWSKDPELIISESAAQVGGPGGVNVMSKMLDLAEEFNVSAIYTGAAFAVPTGHREPVRLMAAANNASIRDSLAKHGAESLPEGHISGMNGLLLGFAGHRQLDAACLLATMPQYAVNMPNPKSSREVVRAFQRVLGLSVAMEEIDQAVETTERTMEEIESQIRTAFSQMAPEDETEEELGEVEEEQVPQYVMQKIDRLFSDVEKTRSQDKATELKRELDKWNLYRFYEDRFLNLFRKGQDEDEQQR